MVAVVPLLEIHLVLLVVEEMVVVVVVPVEKLGQMQLQTQVVEAEVLLTLLTLV